VRAAFGERFDIRPGYLNTASIGVPSLSTADAMVDAIADWRSGSAQPAEFDADVDTARAGHGHSARLAEAGVVASARAGRIRLSFHLYNTMADVALVLRALGR
jgi:hypothetical protein